VQFTQSIVYSVIGYMSLVIRSLVIESLVIELLGNVVLYAALLIFGKIDY